MAPEALHKSSGLGTMRAGAAAVFCLHLGHAPTCGQRSLYLLLLVLIDQPGLDTVERLKEYLLSKLLKEKVSR